MNDRFTPIRGWRRVTLAGVAAVVASTVVVTTGALAAPGGEKGKPESKPQENRSQPRPTSEPTPQSTAKEPEPQSTKPAPPASKPKPAPTSDSGARAHGNSDSPKRDDGSKPAKTRGPSSDAREKETSQGSTQSHGPAGKTTFCHSTRSAGNPYVGVTTSNNALPTAHERHHSGDDIIPASGDCPGSAGRSSDQHGKSAANGSATHGPGGKETYCHSTRSATNPFVVITTSVNALAAHVRHHDGDDIIPASGNCPGSNGTNAGGNNGGPNTHGPGGKETYCHSTRSATNPFVVITTSVNALAAHVRHHDGDDIIPAVNGACPGQTTTPAVTEQPGPDGDDGAPGAGGGPGDSGVNGADDGDGPGPQNVADGNGPGTRDVADSDVLGESDTGGPGATEPEAGGPGATDPDAASAPTVADEQPEADGTGTLPFTGRSLAAVLVAALLALAIGIVAHRVAGRPGA
jgi:hypothetical protein